MLNFFKPTNHCYYFLFFFFINKLFVESKYLSFPLITLKGEFKPLHIKYDDINLKRISECTYLFPSLFIPFLLVNRNFPVRELSDLELKVDIISPILLNTYASLFNYSLFDKYHITLAKDLKNNERINDTDCFFGLSILGNVSNLNEFTINLNKLIEFKIIEKKIFSFDIWYINGNEITSNLYLGNEHEIFNSSSGIIGTCNIDKNDSYWGCTFKEMKFNNKIIKLSKIDDSFYKIYFSSESHKIIFPNSFKTTFNEATNNVCIEKSPDGLSCPSLFMNSENYTTLKLIDDNMIITTEIDNLKRFNLDYKGDSDKTRIVFEESIEYFVFPLIMFKNFFVQFDLNKNIISFFTNDNSILEIIKDDKEPEDSNAGKVFLIIFIIILIIALGFLIFWFIKRRGSSVEKNINKYNKFEEDDEVLKNMNEKRVF